MTRKNEQNSHSIDFLFVLLTFAIYAICMIALIYMGAMVYRSVTADKNSHDTVRTTVAYLREKVRQNDSAGAISIGAIGEDSALEIRQTYNDTEYTTYIYAADGSLCELFTRSDNEVDPSAGTRLLSLKDLEFSIEENGLIHAALIDNENKEHGFYLYPMSPVGGGEQ